MRIFIYKDNLIIVTISGEDEKMAGLRLVMIVREHGSAIGEKAERSKEEQKIGEVYFRTGAVQVKFNYGLPEILTCPIPDTLEGSSKANITGFILADCNGREFFCRIDKERYKAVAC